LSETDAFLKEKEEISFWGRRTDGGFLINLTDGGEGMSGYVYTADRLAKHKASLLKRYQDPAARAKLTAAAQKRAKEFSVISPDGTLYPNQRNVSEFCKIHGLVYSCMRRVVAGTYAHHKGWRMYTDGMLCAPYDHKLHKTTAREFSVISPDGTLYLNQRNLAEFCKVHGLGESSMGRVLKGERPHHKGWRMYTDGMPCVPHDFREFKEFSVISPDGTLYLTQRNVSEFSKVHGLDESCMRKVLKGTHNHHKGWKTYTPPSNNHLINQFL
jgi:hypothetical protein